MKQKTSVVGITGPSGAGKSALGSFLTEMGYPCIDADAVYHTLLIPPSPCLDAIRLAFGNGVMTPEGGLDRKALGEVVFHNAEKLELLNRTVLPCVLDEIRRQIAALAESGSSLIFVDAPTLIESGFHKECDTVISILAKDTVRVDRIALRDSLDKEQAYARIRAQKDDDFYRCHSDHVLFNDGDRDAFLAQARSLLNRLTASL